MENQTGGDLVVKETYLSIVIPAYNEEDNIQALYEKLSFECKKIDQDYEIIFVDDGSDDSTFKLLCELQSQDSSVKIIKLSRNHGHQLALSAGIDNASGEYTITMDSDFQHPPEMIPQFLEEGKKGFDIVTGVKEYTEKRGFLKNILATVYYWFFRKITKINVEPNASDFRLFSKRALTVIKDMRERERYLRGMAEWIGFRHKKIYYVCPERYAGKPKYTISKLAKLASYGILSFSAFPIRVSTYLGIGILLFNILLILFAIIAWTISKEILPNYTLIIILLLFLFSWLFIALGMVGEYILRIYEEVKGRPLYVVEWKKGFDESK